MSGELAFRDPVDPLTAPHHLVSSTVRTVAYDDARQILRVQFRSGATYDYFGVATCVYEALLAAQPHPWTAVGPLIRGFPYKGVTRVANAAGGLIEQIRNLPGKRAMATWSDLIGTSPFRRAPAP
jgi:hypothetical protein